MPGPQVHGLAHIGGGYYVGVMACERCGLNYNPVMREGYRYRPLCPVCAEETGETVETPIPPKDAQP